MLNSVARCTAFVRTEVLRDCVIGILLLSLAAPHSAAGAPIESPLFGYEGAEAFQFSADNKTLVGISGYYGLSFFELATRRFVAKPIHLGGAVRKPAFSASGGIVAVHFRPQWHKDVWDAPIEFYSFPEWQRLARFDDMSSAICQFACGGSVFIAKPNGKDIEIYDVPPHKPPRRTRSIPGTSKTLYAFASPDGKRIGAITSDGGLAIWSVERSEVTKTLFLPREGEEPQVVNVPAIVCVTRPEPAPVEIEFSTDGRFAATLYRRRKLSHYVLQFWNTSNWDCLSSVPFLWTGADHMVFVPNSHLVAIGGFAVPDPKNDESPGKAEGPIAFIEAPIGKIKCWCKPTFGAYAIRFAISSDGSLMAVFTEQNSLQVWKVADILKGS
jgi:WD40 repeat protein